jgi:hypothetical protein
VSPHKYVDDEASAGTTPLQKAVSLVDSADFRLAALRLVMTTRKSQEMWRAYVAAVDSKNDAHKLREAHSFAYERKLHALAQLDELVRKAV